MNSGTPQAITLRQLRAFQTLAREGSFTRAAEMMLMTQPALTACIRQLEDHLGTALFERTTRQVKINALGATLLPRVDRMLSELNDGVDELRRKSGQIAKAIAFATVPSIASSIMPQTLADYAAVAPDVGISLTEDHSEGVRRKVSEGEVDFGLSGISTEVFPDVDARPIFYDEVGLFCHVEHRFAALERSLHWADLAGEKIFNMGYQTQIQQILDVVPELSITLSQTAYKVRNTLTTLSMIRSQSGIAALPKLSIPASALTDVVYIPLSQPTLQREIFLCTKKGKKTSVAAARLIRRIVANAACSGAILFSVRPEECATESRAHRI